MVEAKSFTAAASALGVSKSVVSKRVAALEEQLGARLLQRTARRLVPVLAEFPLEPLGVYVVYSKSKVVPLKVRRLVEHLASRLQPPPWESR